MICLQTISKRDISYGLTRNGAKMTITVFKGLAIARKTSHCLIRQSVTSVLSTSSSNMSNSLTNGSGVRQLLFERITENGYPPTKGSKLAAGYDLYSAYDCLVPKRGKQLVLNISNFVIQHIFINLSDIRLRQTSE